MPIMCNRFGLRIRGGKMKKKIIKRIVVIGILSLLTGLLFYYLHNSVIEKRYYWQEMWDFGERSLYVVFAVLIGTIYKYLYDVLKKIPSKIFVSLGLSAVYTACVFFANNYFHYLEWNSELSKWNIYFPYSRFLKRDITYTYGNGEYRYILIFSAMCLANLAIILYFKRFLPMLKDCIRDLCLWYFGPNEKTMRNKIDRLLTGADYTDFVDEIDYMPRNERSKDLFKKLIDEYDEDNLIELYQALFERFWEYLSREEYLEYRQRYLDKFDEPLPENCDMLDELFEYTPCDGENGETAADQ